jgi:hypothetical protein
MNPDSRIDGKKKNIDPLFKTLLGLDVGETVRVSGRVLAATGERDHFVELSLTWGGAMESPDFAFYFGAVEPRDKPQAAR